MDQKEEQKEHFFLLLSNSSEVSIVDKDDYYRFRGFNWQLKDDGYVITDSSISAKRRGIAAKLRLHRLILGIEDGPDVDHINGNKLFEISYASFAYSKAITAIYNLNNTEVVIGTDQGYVYTRCLINCCI